MIETSIDQTTGLSIIVLRPNNSASWQFNMLIVGSLSFIAFCISTYFALHGLWLIFPFAGIEVGFLFVCLHLRMRANLNTEVITFDKDTVLVERGYYHAEQSWKYHRAIRGYPKQVFIRSHGKELELGSFLNKNDKEQLIKDLKHVVYA